MKKLVFTIILAAVLWTVMFSPWTAPAVNFWWMMTGSALTLSVFATLFSPGWWREVKWSISNVLLGVGIAVALWMIFWVGDKVSTWMFDCPSAGRFHLRYERRRVSLVAGCLDAGLDRACGRNLLAGIRATHAFRTLEESRYGVCGGYGLVRAGTCRLLQFHAYHGGIGGRCGLGSALPFLPESVCRHYPVAFFVGCGCFYLFPYLKQLEPYEV